MSAAEAALLPEGLHAMVDPDPLDTALAEERVTRCKECGHEESMPRIGTRERTALNRARAVRRLPDLAPS
jgi:hypothetical protein